MAEDAGRSGMSRSLRGKRSRYLYTPKIELRLIPRVVRAGIAGQQRDDAMAIRIAAHQRHDKEQAQK